MIGQYSRRSNDSTDAQGPPRETRHQSAALSFVVAGRLVGDLGELTIMGFVKFHLVVTVTRAGQLCY